MTPRAAALGLLLFFAPAQASADPPVVPPADGSGAASGHGPSHETQHGRARRRVNEFEQDDSLTPEVRKNAAVKNKISSMSPEEYQAYKEAMKNADRTRQTNLATAEFVADAVGGRPVGQDVNPLAVTSAGGGVGVGIGLTVAGTPAGPPPETMVDPLVLRSFPPGHDAYPRAQFALAVQDQNRGDHYAALGGFETALAGGQDDARTLTFASLSALNAGDPRKAARWAEQALEKDPSGALAEQAEAIAKMALKRLPREEDPFKNRPARGGDASAGTRAGESVPELERPLPPRAAEPGLPPEAAAVLAKTNRLVAQASQAYRTGDVKEAAKLAGEALAADSDDVRALQVRAAANAKAGNWEEARKDAERGLELAPGYVPLLLLRAAASVHAKDWKAVNEDAGAVLAKERANPTAWRFQGLAQAALGARAASSASLARAAQYGDPEAPRLLAAARSLPPGADVVDLVELLAGSAAEREAATALAAPQAAPAPRRGRVGLVVGAAVLAGAVAGGLILLVGRRDSESA